MIRRMKIKALPNLAGGPKRSTLPGKKVHPVGQENGNEEQSTDDKTEHLKKVQEKEKTSSPEAKENVQNKCFKEENIYKKVISDKNDAEEIKGCYSNSLQHNDTQVKDNRPLSEDEIRPISEAEKEIRPISEAENTDKPITVNIENCDTNKNNRENSEDDSVNKLQVQIDLTLSDVPRKEAVTDVKEQCNENNSSLPQTSSPVLKDDLEINKQITSKSHSKESDTFNTHCTKTLASNKDIDSEDVLINTTKRVYPLTQDQEPLRLESKFPNKIKETVSIKSPENAKPVIPAFKKKIAPNPPNMNLVNKISSRRSRIKGCPVINRRPKHTLISSEIKDNNNSDLPEKVTVLENRNNNDPKLLNDQDIKSQKGNYISLASSQVDSRESVESKENIGQTCLNKLPICKPTSKELSTNKSVYKKNYIKPELSSVIKSEDIKEKRVFYERKLKFRKKLSSGKLERSEMTMFDLIFWNPASNPMPGRTNEDSISRSNSINENESITSEIVEEHKAEEEGLQTVPDEEIVEEPEVVDNEEDEEASTLAPQVKIGPNGDLIVDEKSLVLQTTAAKNRDEILSRTEVVEEPTESSHYGKWSKKRKRSTEWTRKETARFYKALSTVGTDFSLMETVFKWRSRSELKIKFKKEERVNRHLIDTALNDCTQFDFSIFDESDYDPEEDRKKAKEAEKAEAKKKREIEREERKMQKELERKRKKEELKMEKLRKKKLKKMYKKQKLKKASKSPRKRSESTSVRITPQEVICEVVFSNPADRMTAQTHAVIESQDNIATAAASEMQVSSVLPDLFNQELVAITNSIQKGSDKATEPFPISPHPEIVELGSLERIVLSPPPNLNSGVCSISSSCFSVKGTTPLQGDVMVNPEDICDTNELASSITEGEVNDESIAISTIPVSINPELLSNVCEALESSEESRLIDLSEDENNCEMDWERHSEQPQQTDKQDISQFCIPVENVQMSPDGHQFVEITTARGTKRIVVPSIGPQTTHFVVLETPDPENPPEKIYHVYTIAPVDSANEGPSSHTPSTQLINIPKDS